MTERFAVGETVVVKRMDPPGHVRTPHYARGKHGVIESDEGDFANPEQLAYGRQDADILPLYRVRFRQTELWPDYAGAPDDTAVIDLYHHWLEPA
jgi:hypothetical protein